MCFTQPVSFLFSALGFGTAYYFWRNTKNWAIVLFTLYFTAMEFLQFFQFFWVNDCNNVMNKVLTVMGVLHICFQPYFTHMSVGAFVSHPDKKAKVEIVKQLCLIGGIWLFLRVPLATSADLNISPACPSTEWLRANDLCTYIGNYHLAWRAPMRRPSYFIPGPFIHFFLMFVPLPLLGLWKQGLFLLLTGPVLAAIITPNLHEQAAIWCFFSIMQVVLMLLVLRHRLVSRGEWGSGAKPKKAEARPKKEQ